MAVSDYSSIKESVLGCVSARRDVLAAYIFGSVATGRRRQNSDVDVAVLLTERLGRKRLFNYRLQLMSDLGASLRRSDVEVVILNQAPPLLAHRVLSKGELVFERSASARIRFQVMTANRYADLVPAYETYIRYLKQSVREGRIVG